MRVLKAISFEFLSPLSVCLNGFTHVSDKQEQERKAPATFFELRHMIISKMGFH